MISKPRIAAVSLNSAVDQTATVRGLTLNAVNRVDTSRVDAGGKGVNVASFLAHFDHDVTVTGFLGRDNASLFEQHFREAGVADACLRLDGATRTNVKIVDPIADEVTDINFPGVRARIEDLNAVLRRLEEIRIGGLDWIALCGSLPEGLAETAYAELAAWAKARSIAVALDTSGLPLAAALPAKPDIVKPNIAELRDLLEQPLDSHQAVVAAALRLLADGVRLVVVSMGEDGAILVNSERAVHARPPHVPVASTVGAGDAMVAGLIHASTRRLPLDEMARLATAFSLGALGEVGPRLPPRDKIEDLARAVDITELTARPQD